MKKKVEINHTIAEPFTAPSLGLTEEEYKEIMKEIDVQNAYQEVMLAEEIYLNQYSNIAVTDIENQLINEALGIKSTEESPNGNTAIINPMAAMHFLPVMVTPIFYFDMPQNVMPAASEPTPKHFVRIAPKPAQLANLMVGVNPYSTFKQPVPERQNDAMEISNDQSTYQL